MDEPLETKPWDQMPGETDEQYEWFVKHYLSLGLMRNMKKAWLGWVVEHVPLGEQRLNQRPPNHWFDASGSFSWTSRAAAWDAFQSEEASQQVKQALLNLRLATVSAVNTLIKQLDNPRNGVAAAKEILDRGGIPAKSVTDVNQSVTINADDMAKAAKEVDEWEKKILGPSGSSASEA